jgi:hypothetical protein
VVIAAGGGDSFGAGEHLVAFALPDTQRLALRR